jgi:hypothetical protein
VAISIEIVVEQTKLRSIYSDGATTEISRISPVRMSKLLPELFDDGVELALELNRSSDRFKNTG